MSEDDKLREMQAQAGKMVRFWTMPKGTPGRSMPASWTPDWGVVWPDGLVTVCNKRSHDFEQFDNLHAFQVALDAREHRWEIRLLDAEEPVWFAAMELNLGTVREERDQARARRDVLEAERTALAAERDQLREQHAKMQVELEVTHARRDYLRSHTGALDTSLHEVQRALDVTRKERDGALVQVSEVSKQVEQLVGEIERLRLQLREAEGRAVSEPLLSTFRMAADAYEGAVVARADALTQWQRATDRQHKETCLHAVDAAGRACIVAADTKEAASTALLSYLERERG